MIIEEIPPGENGFSLKQVKLSPLLSDAYLRERIEIIERHLQEKAFVWVLALAENLEARERLKADLAALARYFSQFSELILAPIKQGDAVAMILGPKLSPVEDRPLRTWRLPDFPLLVFEDIENGRCLLSDDEAKERAEALGFDAKISREHWPRRSVLVAAGSLRYEAQRRLKAKNRARGYANRRVKEIRIRTRIQTEDLWRKARDVRRLLGQQHRVRVRVNSLGPRRHDSEGRRRIFKELLELVGEVADAHIPMEERRASLLATLSPACRNCGRSE